MNSSSEEDENYYNEIDNGMDGGSGSSRDYKIEEDESFDESSSNRVKSDEEFNCSS
jgi:hypothetical protein